MARAFEHRCTECHVAVRPQVWVELVSRGEGHACEGCGRLLYRDENLNGMDRSATRPVEGGASGPQAAGTAS